MTVICITAYMQERASKFNYVSNNLSLSDNLGGSLPTVIERVEMTEIEMCENTPPFGQYKLTKRMTVQAVSYVLAYFLTWIFVILSIIKYRRANETGNKSSLGTLRILVQIFLPLQGFFNLFVFMRPRVYVLYLFLIPD